MATVQWKIEGMTCANCALSINKYLENQGQRNIKINPIDGELSFESADPAKKDKLIRGIEDMGFMVIQPGEDRPEIKKPFLKNHFERFLFCLPFTLLLMLHMLEKWVHIPWIMNPWIQLIICLPVYYVGMSFFGRSAVKSLRNGIPNMNVLIAMGATASFVYSLAGTFLNRGTDYLFYETTATIITLVFLGNYLEDRSVQSTRKALDALISHQKVMANMIAFDGDHQEVILPLENTQLQTGDLILINSGEQVPIDSKILWGEGHFNESLLTGESTPVHKKSKDLLIGGSILESGTVRAQVTATGDDTVLSGIIRMVRKAQSEKPPVQLLADRISAIFVPVVAGIALLTLIVNWIVLDAFAPALMRSIAVLVIACPCAMGLATPAAIAVGLGRAARSGILFRYAASLENFRKIKTIVFDKTGTLTTGKFQVTSYQAIGIEESELKRIAWSLEKHSSHPLAKSISTVFRTGKEIRWKSVEEIKGLGMKAADMQDNVYQAGSYRIAAHLTGESHHNVYLTRNNQLIGWIDVEDEVRPEATEIISWLKAKGLHTVLLSGDTKEKCEKVAGMLGIEEVFAHQSPEQKLEKIAAFTARSATAYVGDGINDAPALAKATIGISLSEASQLAMQSAHVVLMNHGLKNLPSALGLGRHTYLTIQQNLFWAFFYNIIAIPVAALGYLTPAFSALVMGFSDVVLGINSVRLFVKKVV